MIYNNIFLIGSCGYEIITPIDWKNESRQTFPIIAEKITEYEGIKICYRILIYDTSFNIHFESVSILGHKCGYVIPSHYQQLYQLLKGNIIGSTIEQFESYAQNNITNNLNYYNYDINNIKLFTADTYEGMKLFRESLIASKNLRQSLIERNKPIDDRISNTTNDRIEEEKLIEDINRHIDKIFENSSGFENFKTTVSDISENEIKVDLKKQPLTNDLNVLENPYEIRQVDDINNIDDNIKVLCVYKDLNENVYDFIINISIKENNNYHFFAYQPSSRSYRTWIKENKKAYYKIYNSYGNQ